MTFLLTNWRMLAAAVLACLLCATLGYCEGRRAGMAAADVAIQRANVKALERNAAASEKASAERVSDAEEVIQIKKELEDAVAQIPDSVPDAHAVALGCERLRRAGRDTSSIPACSGH